jgi:MinD-like ATPase involved in chromosome partitioning or flagellar assembly
MKTITFYSYKGGTGRSLALANAARYLARLEFKVVALDFDLEAPGLHYKFSGSAEGKPLPVQAGVVDYLHTFVVEGRIPDSLQDFTIDVSVPGVDKPLIQLIAAGKVLSKDYWSKLSRINWYDLFYSKGAKGVQVFLELKNRISDELNPDFLLIDSRTGITEMGGVATTLLADKVICLVLPMLENLEGARAVLRSLNRSRRESGIDDLELMVALSRLPQMKDSESERDVIDRIRSVLNEEADDLADTLSCSDVFVLHSEAALEVQEALRVGSGISTDDSILLRDYLRLFANVVPKELIEPKVGKLIQQAREKI